MKLTEEELTIINQLGYSWDCFLKLDEYHPCDKVDMMNAIHQAQQIIMSRLAIRAHPDLFRNSSLNQTNN